MWNFIGLHVVQIYHHTQTFSNSPGIWPWGSRFDPLYRSIRKETHTMCIAVWWNKKLLAGSAGWLFIEMTSDPDYFKNLPIRSHTLTFSKTNYENYLVVGTRGQKRNTRSDRSLVGDCGRFHLTEFFSSSVYVFFSVNIILDLLHQTAAIGMLTNLSISDVLWSIVYHRYSSYFVFRWLGREFQRSTSSPACIGKRQFFIFNQLLLFFNQTFKQENEQI